jgi:hypothetical protein
MQALATYVVIKLREREGKERGAHVHASVGVEEWHAWGHGQRGRAAMAGAPVPLSSNARQDIGKHKKDYY